MSEDFRDVFARKYSIPRARKDAHVLAEVGREEAVRSGMTPPGLPLCVDDYVDTVIKFLKLDIPLSEMAKDTPIDVADLMALGEWSKIGGKGSN